MVHVPAVAVAVNRPFPSIVPHDDVQLAAMFALNCCVMFTGVVGDAGVTVSGEEIVTFADAVRLLPSLAVPVTLQDDCASGAVNTPFVSMLPQVALHREGRLAVKFWVAPSATVGFCGEVV